MWLVFSFLVYFQPVFFFVDAVTDLTWMIYPSRKLLTLFHYDIIVYDICFIYIYVIYCCIFLLQNKDNFVRSITTWFRKSSVHKYNINTWCSLFWNNCNLYKRYKLVTLNKNKSTTRKCIWTKILTHFIPALYHWATLLVVIID